MLGYMTAVVAVTTAWQDGRQLPGKAMPTPCYCVLEGDSSVGTLMDLM